MWETTRQINIQKMCTKERREKGEEKVFKEIMAEGHPNLMKNFIHPRISRKTKQDKYIRPDKSQPNCWKGKDREFCNTNMKKTHSLQGRPTTINSWLLLKSNGSQKAETWYIQHTERNKQSADNFTASQLPKLKAKLRHLFVQDKMKTENPYLAHLP